MQKSRQFIGKTSGNHAGSPLRGSEKSRNCREIMQKSRQFVGKTSGNHAETMQKPSRMPPVGVMWGSTNPHRPRGEGLSVGFVVVLVVGLVVVLVALNRPTNRARTIEVLIHRIHQGIEKILFLRCIFLHCKIHPLGILPVFCKRLFAHPPVWFEP